MPFTSIYYLYFLPVVVVLYWRVPRRLRYPLLLVASYLFYANWIPAYLPLILLLTAANYGWGLLLARRRHRLLLAMAVATNLGVLAYFKYANFLLDTVRPAGVDLSALQILLPLGISFFTFEFIHYVVDVWRGSPPVRNVIYFALFAAFFPTQVSGPIKRYQDFVPQLLSFRRFNWLYVQAGVHLILRGLFKKVILADNLAPKVDLGFANLARLGTAESWLTIYAFAFQIFFDFSGYTDIARGSALLLGLRVPKNFMAPYLARSPADFWRRWHISLSSWLRDYIYIPLGGSRRGRLRTYFNLFVTMLLGGLWHGASWHFVVWGAYQGLGLAGTRLWSERHGWQTPDAEQRSPSVLPSTVRPRPSVGHSVRSGLGIAATFHFICLGWVLFRAPDLASAGQLFSHMLWPTPSGNLFNLNNYILVLGIMVGYFTLASWAAWVRPLLPIWSTSWRAKWNWVAWPAVYVALITWLVVFPPNAQRFIYFQF